MKTLNFTIIASVAFLSFLFSILIFTLAEIFEPKPKWEIYTPEDIYYIDGLRLESETGIDTIFVSQKDLEIYLANITAEDSKHRVD